MNRPTVTLEAALAQVLAEARHEKVAAKGYGSTRAPAGDPAADELRKVAAALRTATAPAVSYEDLNRVKEALYGRR